MGNFNVNLRPSATNSGDLLLKRNFLQLLSKFNLKYVISVPTIISGNSSTLIDLIITSISHKLLHHGACNLGISNHHLIYVTIKLRRSYQKVAFKLIRDFKSVSITALKHEFASLPGTYVTFFMTLMTLSGHGKLCITISSIRHIPIRKVKIRSSSLAWMTSSLLKEKNKRSKLLILAQIKTLQNYKKQRNLCNKLLRSAELAYWSDKFSNAKSSKEFWKTVKLFQGTNKFSSIGPIKDQQVIPLTD